MAGVIDFYFACNAPFLYDLAVTLNDWTIDLETGEFEPDRAQAMLEGYNSVRPLTEEDHKLWQDILSAAALRFWVSRLYDYYMPRPASLLTPHDPRISNVFLNFAANPRLKIYLGSKTYLIWKIITFLLKREWTGCEAHVLLSNVRPQLFFGILGCYVLALFVANLPSELLGLSWLGAILSSLVTPFGALAFARLRQRAGQRMPSDTLLLLR